MYIHVWRCGYIHLYRYIDTYTCTYLISIMCMNIMYMVGITMWVYTNRQTCIYISTYINLHSCVHVHTYIHPSSLRHTYIHVSTHMNTCMCNRAANRSDQPMTDLVPPQLDLAQVHMRRHMGWVRFKNVIRFWSRNFQPDMTQTGPYTIQV